MTTKKQTAAESAPAPAQASERVSREDSSRKRIEEIRAKRRTRDTVDVSGFKQKLSVPMSRKDPLWEYRWVNDSAMRIHDLQEQDWEFADDPVVSGDDRNSGVGTRIERIVNERTTPKPERAYLMRKPKEFYSEDQARKHKFIDEVEEGIKRGKTQDPQGLAGPEAYVPQGGISIKHGR